MDILIDVSCVLAVLAQEEQRDKIIEKTRGTHLVSAACLPYEMGNALSAMVKRRRIDGEMAIRVYKEFERIPVRLLEVNMGRAIQIAAEENHYAYDAYYVACALEAGLPLYSLDVRMVEIARKRGIVCW